MKHFKLTADERTNAMLVMRAYHVPDEAIAGAFGVSRQRVHKLLGARPRVLEDPLPDGDADARLGPELRAWRLRRGLTQREAADRIGVGIGAINMWENGRGGCRVAELVLRFLATLDRYEPPAV